MSYGEDTETDRHRRWLCNKFKNFLESDDVLVTFERHHDNINSNLYNATKSIVGSSDKIRKLSVEQLKKFEKLLEESQRDYEKLKEKERRFRNSVNILESSPEQVDNTTKHQMKYILAEPIKKWREPRRIEANPRPRHSFNRQQSRPSTSPSIANFASPPPPLPHVQHAIPQIHQPQLYQGVPHCFVVRGNMGNQPLLLIPNPAILNVPPPNIPISLLNTPPPNIIGAQSHVQRSYESFNNNGTRNYSNNLNANNRDLRFNNPRAASTSLTTPQNRDRDGGRSGPQETYKEYRKRRLAEEEEKKKREEEEKRRREEQEKKRQEEEEEKKKYAEKKKQEEDDKIRREISRQQAKKRLHHEAQEQAKKMNEARADKSRESVESAAKRVYSMWGTNSAISTEPPKPSPSPSTANQTINKNLVPSRKGPLVRPISGIYQSSQVAAKQNDPGETITGSIDKDNTVKAPIVEQNVILNNLPSAEQVQDIELPTSTAIATGNSDPNNRKKETTCAEKSNEAVTEPPEASVVIKKEVQDDDDRSVSSCDTHDSLKDRIDPYAVVKSEPVEPVAEIKTEIKIKEESKDSDEEINEKDQLCDTDSEVCGDEFDNLSLTDSFFEQAKLEMYNDEKLIESLRQPFFVKQKEMLSLRVEVKPSESLSNIEMRDTNDEKVHSWMKGVESGMSSPNIDQPADSGQENYDNDDHQFFPKSECFDDEEDNTIIPYQPCQSISPPLKMEKD